MALLAALKNETLATDSNICSDSLAYLVALGGLATGSRTSTLHAVAGDVSGLAALVAGLVVLGGLLAVTAWGKSVDETKKQPVSQRLTDVSLAYHRC